MIAVGKVNAGDRQRNAEVDRPPWIRMRQGVHAAVAVPEIRVATAVDSIAGRVTDAPGIHMHADLSGRHVDGHVTHLVRVR